MNTGAILWAVTSMDDLTPSERSVLLSLAVHADDAEQGWETVIPVDALADDANVSVRRCYDHLDRLVAAGIIERSENDERAPRYRYFLPRD